MPSSAAARWASRGLLRPSRGSKPKELSVVPLFSIVRANASAKGLRQILPWQTNSTVLDVRRALRADLRAQARSGGIERSLSESAQRSRIHFARIHCRSSTHAGLGSSSTKVSLRSLKVRRCHPSPRTLVSGSVAKVGSVRSARRLLRNQSKSAIQFRQYRLVLKRRGNSRLPSTSI